MIKSSGDSILNLRFTGLRSVYPSSVSSLEWAVRGTPRNSAAAPARRSPLAAIGAGQAVSGGKRGRWLRVPTTEQGLSSARTDGKDRPDWGGS